MADTPGLVAKVILEFNFPEKGYSEGENRLIESVARTSPVPLSVHPDLKQTLKFKWSYFMEFSWMI